jgi:gliding motility-associated-like protein
MSLFKLKRVLFVYILLITLALTSKVFSQNYVVSGSELSIVGNLDFSTSAAWDTDKSSLPGFFTWVNNAENYTGVSDLFHVNGYVKKIGSQGFIFPVGDGVDLRTLQMSAPTSSTSEYAVAWLGGNPDVTPDPTNSNQLHSTSAVSGTIKAVSPVGQWDWLPVNGTGEGLSITVSIPELTGDFFTNASDVRLVGWNGSTWVGLGTNGASGLLENSTLSGTMIAGIQAIGIGSIKSITNVPAAPVFTVVQNSDGTLTVSGSAEKDGNVIITFPDKSTITVAVNSQGLFGPVTSLLPQVLKDVVKATFVNSIGATSIETSVAYETKLTVLASEAFTPNGDGINDTWKIVDIEKFPNTTVRVFNRWGHLVFSAKNYQNDWAGNYNDFNSILPESSSYYYQIDYGTDGAVDKEGWLYIRK